MLSERTSPHSSTTHGTSSPSRGCRCSPKTTRARSKQRTLSRGSQRGTTPVALRFAAPDVVDDQLWPELRKSLDGLCSELDRRGFEVLRSAAFVEDDSGKPETLDTESRGRDVVRARVRCRRGSRLLTSRGATRHVREHAASSSRSTTTTPRCPAPSSTASDTLSNGSERLPQRLGPVECCRLRRWTGQRIESALENGFEVLVGTDIAALADGFGVDLASYFDPKP